MPRALDIEELPRIVDEFRQAARNAIDAGMDGVELHGANGYLLHQFLSPSSNHREDAYGGTPEKRYRLVVEILRAVAEEIGADRVALRLSPQHNIQGIEETDAADVRATYGVVTYFVSLHKAKRRADATLQEGASESSKETVTKSDGLIMTQVRCP